MLIDKLELLRTIIERLKNDSGDEDAGDTALDILEELEQLFEKLDDHETYYNDDEAWASDLKQLILELED